MDLIFQSKQASSAGVCAFFSSRFRVLTSRSKAYTGDKVAAPSKSWGRKLAESLITLYLEQRLTKQQTFEYYANQVYLGRRGTFSIRGFGEGAWAYFEKELSRLNNAEAALLAGLVQRPSYYNAQRHPD